MQNYNVFIFNINFFSKLTNKFLYLWTKFLWLFFCFYWLVPGNKKNIATYKTNEIINQINTIEFVDYPDLWKEVDKFEKKSLTKSAYQSVQKIYRRAKKDNNSPQIIKHCSIYPNIWCSWKKTGQFKNCTLYLEKELGGNKFPTFHI